jgi:hypothetical protein
MDKQNYIQLFEYIFTAFKADGKVPYKYSKVRRTLSLATYSITCLPCCLWSTVCRCIACPLMCCQKGCGNICSNNGCTDPTDLCMTVAINDTISYIKLPQNIDFNSFDISEKQKIINILTELEKEFPKNSICIYNSNHYKLADAYFNCTPLFVNEAITKMRKHLQ